MSSRLPATADIVFQYVMASEGSEKVLRSFINAVQGDGDKPLAESVSIQNPFNQRRYEEDKMSILDIKAVGKDSKKYNIEVQTANQPDFLNRILYYWCCRFRDQLGDGDDYSKLYPTISIVVARFERFPQLLKMHNMFSITAQADPSCLFTDLLLIHTLELVPHKIEQIPTLKRPLYQWLDFLVNVSNKPKQNPDSFSDNEGLAMAYDNYYRFCEDQYMRDLREAAIKRERDQRGQLAFARGEGEKIGIVKGEKIGIVKGEKIGIVKGEKIGIVKGEIKACKKSILRCLGIRFPNQNLSEVESALGYISDLEELERLRDITFDVPSIEKFMEYLD